MQKKHDVNLNGIIDQLLENAKGISHGEVSVSLKLHEKQIVHITFSNTVTVRRPHDGSLDDLVKEIAAS